MEKDIEWITNEKNCHIVVSHCKNEQGYVFIKRNGKLMRLHRYVYTLKHGEIPKNMVIMHTCDNPSCINIDHLVLGTQNDNVQDMINKKRSNYYGNQRNEQTIYDGELIKKARKRLRISQTELAELVGISRMYLYTIETNKCNPSKEIINKIMEVLE